MFAKDIRAGAKLLDRKLPCWVERQDLERLNLDNICNCVVGQSFPEKRYVKALIDLFDMSDEDEMEALSMSRRYGFSAEDWETYPELTQEWKAYIQERRNQVQNNTIEQVP